MPAIHRAMALILLSLSSVSSRAEMPLQVVASIKPLQLMALAVGGDGVRVDVLVEPNSSPHHYQLRPSDRSRLGAADAVFWVGPRLEHFLQPVLKVTPGRIVALDDGQPDPHIWMDPIAMKGVATRMVEAYTALRPAQTTQFQANAERIKQALDREDAALRARFAAIHPAPYIVEHDAYRRFELRYGLKHRAAITDISDLPPPMSAMLRLRDEMNRGVIGCVLSEPQESALVRALTEGRSVRLVRLDPMAAEIQPPADGLPEFYRRLGKSFEVCLGSDDLTGKARK